MIPLRQRLAYRQTRTMLFWGIVLGLLVSMVQVVLIRADLRAEVRSQIGNLIVAVRGSAAQAVFELDTRLAGRVIDGLFSYRVIRSAQIIDEKGKALASDSRVLASSGLVGAADWLLGVKQPHHVLLVPSSLTGPLGALEITEDNTRILQVLLRRSAVTVYGTMLWAVLISGLLALLLHYSLIRSLMQIVSSISRIHPEQPQNTELVIPKGHKQDELGLLVYSLQALIERYSLSLAAQMQAERSRVEAEARMRSVFDYVPMEIYLKDLEGRYLFVNKRFATIYKAPQDAFIGKSVHDLLSVEDALDVEEVERSVIVSGQPVQYTHSDFTKVGDTFMAVKFPIHDEMGTLTGLGGVEIDISERTRAEDALKLSEARFRDVVDASADAVWEVNSREQFSYVSDRLCELTGFEREALLDHTPRDVFRASVEPAELVVLALTFSKRQQFRDVRLRFRHLDNHHRDWSLSGKPVYDDAGEFLGYRGTGTDITEAQNLARELVHQASHDGLTGLINRHSFEERLKRAIQTARQEGIEHVVFFIDLDQFKVINDTCGHTAGDELLRQVSRLLEEQVRQRDTLARLGGDEFGVLLEHCPIEQATRVAQSILDAVAKVHFNWEGQSFRIGASIGIVPVSDLSGDIGEIMATADSACYAAKDRGRQRYHIYHPDDAELAERFGEMRWVSRINQALDSDAFELFYQTIMPVSPSAGENAKAHYEILLRMRGENNTWFPPGAFLPAAERYGLVSKLDRWVVRSTLDWLQSHPQHLTELELCSINLSGHSIGDEDFLEFLLHCIEQHAVPAEKLCFEITETAAISNLASASGFIQKLTAQGCRFSLDDFGSGLSSFAYLKSLAVDFLKIDGIFVREIASSNVDRAMVKSINELGHVTGKQIVAEFVENESILNVLRELGVDYAQGYGIARPAPIGQLLSQDMDLANIS